MAQVESAPPTSPKAASGFGTTERVDAWWAGPLATGVGLASFVIYSTARALYNGHYQAGLGSGILENQAYLLSPFYSPLFVLPQQLAWISPAFLILWAPGGFRVTCYYFGPVFFRNGD